ncbi:universal stress protein [Aquisalimonas sp.]|uniref:universal stress protein n=1 Tax=Aquisalimonas sp. TaxID=1872621 RepID=UPI0025C1AA4B|nr:universal stress protein [Aquisalimonas sp.]
MSTQEIVVPVDWTPKSLAALAPARVLAEQTGRALHMVSVIPREASSAERERALEQAARDYSITKPRITVLKADLSNVAIGEHEGSLRGMLDESPESLVCMSTHARSAVGDMLLGSVANDLLRQLGRPIVLAGPRLSADWQGPLNMVIVCLDGSELSEAIIEPAVDMAKETGAQLFLTQAQEPESTHTALTQDASESGYLQRKATEILKQYGVQANWDVLHGRNPARAITEYVSGFPGAMVAMTTHGRTGLRKLALGSVARDVVHDIHCPVLAYTPVDQA